MLNKVSEAEIGVHTAPLSHGEVHTSEGEQDPEQPELLPPSWSSHLLVTSCVDAPCQDMGSTDSITARAITLNLILFPIFSGSPYPPGTTLSATKCFATKDLDELFKKVLIVNMTA